MGALLWQEQFYDDAEIVLQNMGSEEEAREWLKALPKNTFK
ncbi:hypothetical protein [Shewanella surugensis]|nr:hypothetical protein [Shewanella surugensis]